MGDSLASEFYVLTFWNTLSVPVV